MFRSGFDRIAETCLDAKCVARPPGVDEGRAFGAIEAMDREIGVVGFLRSKPYPKISDAHHPPIRQHEGRLRDALSRARDTCREHEIMFADRVDVRALVRRLRRDALAAHRRPDDVTQLFGRADARVLCVADEALERRLAQRFIALRQRAHRADQLPDPRDVRRLAADPKFGPSRDDLHLELALDPIDVLIVRADHEHHLVGIGDEDRDLRGRAHESAFAFSIACTICATWRPSARSFVSAVIFGMTLPMSRGPAAPGSFTTRSAIARISCSLSCCGRDWPVIARPPPFLAANSPRPPLPEGPTPWRPA